MKRLYWEDTYLMEHKTKIMDLGHDDMGSWIRVDATIFHPQGGGQPSDEGTINNVKVLKLVDLRDINEINHYVEDISQFKVGDTVTLNIDQARRLENAALHTAGHITAGILRTDYHYHEQISANHFPKQAKVEFKLNGDPLQKQSFEDKAQSVIKDARNIREKYHENGTRCIEIDGLWIEPCSGTHVSDTSQIHNYEIRKLETKKARLTVGYNAQYLPE